MVKVDFECDNCGKKASKWDKHYEEAENHYCSLECYQKTRNGKLDVKCEYCGNQFETYPSKIKRRKNVFCSRECSSNAKRKDHPVKNCQECGEEFEIFPSQEKYKENKYCSKECYGKANKKERVEVECRYCDKSIKKKQKQIEVSDNYYCNHECLGKYQSENWNGEEHPAWKGGHPDFYGKNWKKKRRETLERDNYECQMCGTKPEELGHELDVHHIRPIRTFDEPEDANFSSNLISVCRECHRMIEGEDRKEVEEVKNP